MSDDHPHVVLESAVEWDRQEHGRRTFRQRRLGHATDGEALGTSLYELPPGNRTWPAHYHTANEEAVYVLEDEVTLWLGAGGERTEHRLTPGTFVALPTGPEFTHELEAAGEEPARFLVVSTMREPDFTVLTEAGKAHLVAGDAPGEYGNRYVSHTLAADALVDYWDDGSGDGSDGDGDGDADGAPIPGTAGDAVAGELRRVDAANLEWTHTDRGDHEFRRKQLGAAAGSERLGASLYEVPAGKRAWLPHYHTANEEAIHVLDGAGTVRLGPDREEVALESGSYVALPAGEAGFHDVRAARSGDGPLRYLMLSTMREPDVTVYPEDGTVGLYAGSPPGGDKSERTISRFLDADAEVPYWDE